MSVDNSRIAKNTVYLYIRMLFILGANFFAMCAADITKDADSERTPRGETAPLQNLTSFRKKRLAYYVGGVNRPIWDFSGGYEKPYAADKRRVMAIGVNYDPRKAGIEVISEVVNPSDEVVNPVDEVVNEVVKSHPGLRKPELVPLVGKSRATVERALASLISSGRIEFRGAPKNGGYYVISGER